MDIVLRLCDDEVYLGLENVQRYSHVSGFCADLVRSYGFGARMLFCALLALLAAGTAGHSDATRLVLERQPRYGIGPSYQLTTARS